MKDKIYDILVWLLLLFYGYISYMSEGWKGIISLFIVIVIVFMMFVFLRLIAHVLYKLIQTTINIIKREKHMKEEITFMTKLKACYKYLWTRGP